LTLGRNHEQQHQELLLTDIKHILWSNPMRPVYQRRQTACASYLGRPDLLPASRRTEVLSFSAGIASLGAASDREAFTYDNEKPKHRIFLEAYGMHSLPVSCGEYLEFIESGGYRNPALWLSEGWDEARKRDWQTPLYWEKNDNHWSIYTLTGTKPLNEHEPVCHISYYEADAFARWRGLRLPTEGEWEHAAGEKISSNAHLLERLTLHPEAPTSASPSFFGNSWEWTSSAYSPYPGFKSLAAGLGEYNAKFMCKQFVLRGGSCATSASHLRRTYRNFFAPETRWQFSGMRLAL